MTIAPIPSGPTTPTPAPTGTPLPGTGSRIIPIAILAGIWVVFLALGLGTVLIPPLAALALVYLLMPLHNQSWAARTMIAVGVLATIWLLGKVISIVWVAGLGLFLAYVLNPPVTWLEKKGVPRSRGALYLMLPMLVFVAWAGYMIVPRLISQGISFIGDFPKYVTTLSERYQNIFQDGHLKGFPLDLGGLVATLSDSLKKMAGGAGQSILHVAKRAGTILAIMILTPVVGYNILKDFPMIQKNSLRLVPRRYEGEILDLFSEMDILIGRWLRGQITVSAISGTLTLIMMSIIGLPYAILIGVATGFLNLVPIVGFWISFFAAMIVALTTADPLRMSLWVIGGYIVIQLLEQNFYAPKIMGHHTGLHPVAVLLTLLIFGTLLGFAGALLAIPITLFLRVFFRRYVRHHLRGAGGSATLVTPPGVE